MLEPSSLITTVLGSEHLRAKITSLQSTVGPSPMHYVTQLMTDSAPKADLAYRYFPALPHDHTLTHKGLPHIPAIVSDFLTSVLSIIGPSLIRVSGCTRIFPPLKPDSKTRIAPVE
jgi:hypothetical protein